MAELTILDPTDERTPVRRSLARRPEALGAGTRIALLDISKPRGDVFLNRLEQLLTARLPGTVITRYSKPTFTKPAPEELRQRILAEADVVIEGLAD